MPVPGLDDFNPAGRTVLVRVDLNVPMAGGTVSDWTRVDRHRQTIEELAGAGARVVLLAHFGRPKGNIVPEMSLRPVAEAMSAYLGREIAFSAQTIGATAQAQVNALPAGGILVLENLRFDPREEANDGAFAGELAGLGDIYVNDAFSAAHRAHASTAALAGLLPAYAGRAMHAELTALHQALEHPARPVVAVVGGAKVSSKIDLLANLVSKVDHLVIGGGMANTFLAAEGYDVGASLCEHDLLETAREIRGAAEAANCMIHLPQDVVVATSFAAHAPNQVVDVDKVPADQMILDLGPAATDAIAALFANAATLVWNGPLGAFEIAPFDRATVAAAQAAAQLTEAGSLISVAGGGDTVAALNHAGVAGKFSYISAAGGAFLEWMEGKDLPGVVALGRG